MPTLTSDDLAEKLASFDRRKHDREIQSQSARSLSAVASIATDTPVTILLDIRQLLVDLSKSTTQYMNDIEAQRQRDETRHTELLAYISDLTEQVKASKIGGQIMPTVMSRSTGKQTPPTDYYYRGDRIKTPEALVGCILYHLDSVIHRISGTTDVTDTTAMEVKDWSTIVRLLRRSNSNRTRSPGVLKLPSLASVESLTALSIVAADTVGRDITCMPSHISTLINKCDTIMSCVEEIRQRLMLCHGFISQQRYNRLHSTSYPFVSTDGTVIISNSNPDIIPAIIIGAVKAMKDQVKQKYVDYILRDSMIQMKALVESRRDS